MAELQAKAFHICIYIKALHIGNANNCFEFLSLISNAGHKRRNFWARTSIFSDCEYAQNVSFLTACIDAELGLKTVEFKAKTLKLNEGWKIEIFQQKKKYIEYKQQESEIQAKSSMSN